MTNKHRYWFVLALILGLVYLIGGLSSLNSNTPSDIVFTVPNPPRPELQAAAGPAPHERRTAPSLDLTLTGGQLQGPEAVYVSFYYCYRTLDVPDDGGGYCGGTATGTQVLRELPAWQRIAACPSSWLGRSFILLPDTTFTEPGHPSQPIYTCEDTGQLAANQVDIHKPDNASGWSWLKQYGTHRNLYWLITYSESK